MRLKIVSWNIWGGKRREDVISFLAQENPDIVILQEVSERDVEGRTVNDAQVIGDALGYQAYFGKAFTTDRHFPAYSLGNAVLSKLPIQDSRAVELSGLAKYQKNSTTEPRNAVVATISVDSTPVTIISTHLGYTNDNQPTPLQLIQMEKLLISIPPGITILGADLNSQPTSELVSQMKQSLRERPDSLEEVGSLSENPLSEYRLDYVFVPSKAKINTVMMPDSDASDHLPIILELEID